MNYRHLYHAGNFADVFKHVMLLSALQLMQQKTTPLLYLDTHAGSGLYDLRTARTKTQEAEEGIGRILTSQEAPEIIQTYLTILSNINKKFDTNDTTYYPGSPFFAYEVLRAHDRLLASELEGEAFMALKKQMQKLDDGHTHKPQILNMDGYQSLKAYLPPKEKRGLILIDPPYEKTDEYQRLHNSLTLALKRFQSGVYMVWYPIKDRGVVTRWQRELNHIKAEKLILEIQIKEETPAFLNGCGLLIINPPYQLKENAEKILPYLSRHLGNGVKRWQIRVKI